MKSSIPDSILATLTFGELSIASLQRKIEAKLGSTSRRVLFMEYERLAKSGQIQKVPSLIDHVYRSGL